MPKSGPEATLEAGGDTAKFGASAEAAMAKEGSGQVTEKPVTGAIYKEETFEGKAHALLDTDHETHSEPGNEKIVSVTPTQVPKESKSPALKPSKLAADRGRSDSSGRKGQYLNMLENREGFGLSPGTL